ncbi:superoxide dismutase family protein [Scatolibacter rhodanostii]|uniref:superoxide dismutase family protein n=1 Tax=Scatolibacter rhodanostii TaxID=2014781 RepID=UPI001FA8D3DA|nr:superoxide dismutase family protein [Scatolibacter rhodanostii]
MNFIFGSKSRKYLEIMLRQKPNAVADVSGIPSHRKIKGTVAFFQTDEGVLVRAEFSGLPSRSGKCGGEFLGFHIHEGKTCTGNREDPLADTKRHYNPNHCEHPYHAGDLPPLLSNGGHAFMTVLTNRFTVKDVLGRTVVVHSHADDFHTQPSGDSGAKIACGVIRCS